MFVTEVVSPGKKGQSFRSILLRESYRQGRKVKSRTLAVLTKLPAWLIEVIRQSVERHRAGDVKSVADHSEGQLKHRRSFGAVWVVSQVCERLGIGKALGVTAAAQLGLWQVVARVLEPGVSLLAMVRLAGRCAAAAVLGWKMAFTEDHLYRNGSWLEGRQSIIERRLWKGRSGAENQVFLYDVTSSYLEGLYNELAEWGYNRDRKRGKKQVVVGLLTDAQGDPCAVKVYPGNTSDMKTFGEQVRKIKRNLGCEGVTSWPPTKSRRGELERISPRESTGERARFDC